MNFYKVSACVMKWVVITEITEYITEIKKIHKITMIAVHIEIYGTEQRQRYL